jgi:hypothetical protein
MVRDVERIALLSMRHSIWGDVVEGYGMARECDWKNDHIFRESRTKDKSAHAQVVSTFCACVSRGCGYLKERPRR